MCKCYTLWRYGNMVYTFSIAGTIFTLHVLIPDSLSRLSSEVPALWLGLYFFMLTMFRFGRCIVLIYAVVSTLWELVIYTRLNSVSPQVEKHCPFVLCYYHLCAAVITALTVFSVLFTTPVSMQRVYTQKQFIPIIIITCIGKILTN